MQNRYKEFGKKIRESGGILPFGLWLFIMGVVVLFISFRDFYTSMLGYLELPLAIHAPRTAVEATVQQFSPIAAAFLPQGVTAIGIHLYLMMMPESNTEKYLKWTAGIVAALAAVVDIYTGYVYYIHPMANGFMPFGPEYQASNEIRGMINAALLNSLIIDTFGSEVGSSVVLGTLAVIWKDIWRELEKMFSKPKRQPAPAENPPRRPAPRPHSR